jgi:3'(2'), 5'-bisphosphate nucleotidase
MIQEVFNSIDKIYALLEEAGDVILSKFQSHNLKIILKSDNSPVTEADFASNEIITKKLSMLFPEIPFVSEENAYEDNIKAAQSDLFWSLDPLDGTTNFIKGEELFTINLALINKGVPVIGFLYLPTRKICYCGFGDQVFKRDNGMVTRVQRINDNSVKSFVLSNRADLKIVEKIRYIIAPDASYNILSSAYKYSVLVEGKADCFPCCNALHEWDVAAGHAIVNALGGMVLSLDGKELRYGDAKRNFLSKYFLAVRSATMLNANQIKSIVDIYS